MCGLGLACWSVGDLVLTVEALGGSSVPSPSAADLFYLLFFPLSYAGVVLFVRGETLRLSSPSWLDGAVSGLGAGAVGAAFAFGSIMHGAHESILAAAVNLSYPVGDVFLLLLVVGGTPVMSGRRKAPWLLLAVGFAINSLGDTSNLLHHTPGSSHLATTVDAVAWPTSTLLISLAMWLRPGPADPLATRKPPGFLLPGLAAGAGPRFCSSTRSPPSTGSRPVWPPRPCCWSWCERGCRSGICTPSQTCVNASRSPIPSPAWPIDRDYSRRSTDISLSHRTTGRLAFLFIDLNGLKPDRRFLRPPGRRRDSQPCQRPTRTVTALD